MSKKTHRGCHLLILSIAINALAISPAFAASKAKVSKPQMAGRVATVPSNTILSGTGAPKITIGIDGDFYLDTKAMNFYGPKSKGRWPAAISLRGPQGATGSSGSNGSDGRNAVSAASITGSQGPAGPAGAKGETGAAGVKGDTGPVGTAGVKGDTGPVGTAGVKGDTGPVGTAGSIGATGSNGAPGAQGLPGNTGAQGPAGSNGATGATGPSNAISGAISFANVIQGVAGTSQPSNSFGSFEAGKNYVVRIQIETFNVDVSTYPLSLVISATGAAPVLWTSYLVANGSFWVAGTTRQDKVSLVAEVTINGSATASAYGLVATVTCGLNTGSFPVSLFGKYMSIHVGQVT